VTSDAAPWNPHVVLRQTLRFVATRLLASVPVVALASVVVFVMVATSTDPLSGLRADPRVPAEVIEQRSRELRLDRPVLVRYGLWEADAVRGDLGHSVADRPVGPLVWQRLQITLRMVLAGVVLGLVLAVAAGTVSALRQHRLTDHALSFAGLLLVSMPVFWLGALLKEFVAVRVNDWLGRRVVSTVGASTPNLSGGWWHRVSDYAGHLVLPTAALALTAGAVWSRYQRTAMIEALGADHVRLARAKGLSHARVVVRHALRNALVPLTTVAAVDFAAVVGGAVVLERVFSWQGMGDLLLEGVRAGDVNVVAAWLLVTSVVVVLFNLLADVLYGVLDPRVGRG
jgi:peptide/nickel transport system permease protein